MNKIFKIIFVIVAILGMEGFLRAETVWKNLNDGLSYSLIEIESGKIHALKIDPAKYKFGIVTARTTGKDISTAKAMAKKSGAMIAINGGFFTPKFDSLGLLIDDGKVINPIKNTSWWSVFYIKNGKPNIVHTSGYKNDGGVSMAVQSGPRLLVDRAIPKLKPSYAARSVICVTDADEVVLIATENMAVMPFELAEILKKNAARGGFDCRSALNLDGGTSTQLYVKIGSFKLDIEGAKQVTNAVVVYPKE